MKGRRRYHFHAPGALYIGVTVLMGLGSINSQNNLLFLAFGLALGSILVAGLVSGAALMNIEVKRAPLGVGRVGDPLVFAYSVRNKSRWLPVFGLVVEEFTRRNGAHREHFPRPMAPALHIPARQTRHATATVLPHTRGDVQLTHVRIWTTFPFGILKKSITFAMPGEVLIRPALATVGRNILDQAMSGFGATERVSRRIGRDADFYGLREYAPGDSLKHIAWRASARTGELVVRESYAAVSADVTIVLSFADAEGLAPPTPDEHDERAISVAASLAEAACKRGARVVVLAPINNLRAESWSTRTEVSGSAPLQDSLARLDLESPPELRRPRAIAEIAGGVIVIHAHSVDPSVAPPGAIHISAERAVVAPRTERKAPANAEVAA